VSTRKQSRAMDVTLWGVAGLVMYFSAGNVTTFATNQGTPLHIAVVLAPMVDIALVAALVGDGVLTRQGIRPTGWGTTLRWFAGIATLTVNVWESVARVDAAGIVLHAVPPLLLILLAEAAPQYRRQFAALAERHGVSETAVEERSEGAPEERDQEQPALLPVALPRSGREVLPGSTARRSPRSTPRSADGGRGAGLPKGVRSARELSDAQLAELWRAWSLVTERPSTRAGAVHFALNQERAARVRSLAEAASPETALHVVPS